jgi:hypothetical protein
VNAIELLLSSLTREIIPSEDVALFGRANSPSSVVVEGAPLTLILGSAGSVMSWAFPCVQSERGERRVDVRAWAVAICLSYPRFPASCCLDNCTLEKKFSREFSGVFGDYVA